MNNKLSCRTKSAKKIILIVTTVMCLMSLSAITVFAAPAAGGTPTGEVDTSSFISTTITVLKTVIILIGAGLGIWGVVNLIEGYGNDNAGAKSQGMKQLMAGLALIILAVTAVPVLGDMMTGAMG